MRNAALIRRECIDKAGGFSEEIGGKCGSDDGDMWLSISYEYPITSLHETLSFVREHDKRDSKTLRAIESRVRLWIKWERLLINDSSELYNIAKTRLSHRLIDLAYGYREDGRYLAAFLSYSRSISLGVHPTPALIGMCKLPVIMIRNLMRRVFSRGKISQKNASRCETA